jgi:hypothetical protein
MALAGSNSKVNTSANAVIIVMNIVLYILFIIICVVFQYSEDNSTPVCPGREVLKSNNSVQVILSVIYAAFISALSLGIALGFAIFGTRIVTRMTSQVTQVLKRTAAKVFFSLSCPIKDS